MTAEIAILNKSAVALAADSAVTIGVGEQQQKIYDSADKLFELSVCDAIGVMINSDMNFMEAPLPVLIKEYRATAPVFAHVKDAGDSFLRYLDDFGRLSPIRVQQNVLTRALQPLFSTIEERSRDQWLKRILEEEGGALREEFAANSDKIAEAAEEALDQQFALFNRMVSRLPDAEFVGDGEFEVPESDLDLIRQLVDDTLSTSEPEHIAKAVDLAVAALRKAVPGAATELVIAGFGSEEIFPTLINFSIYGTVGGRLKFRRGETVDIDREGTKARVMAFAQREMVERFLYGLDRGIQESVTKFCENSVPAIAEAMIEKLDMSDEDKGALRDVATAAQAEFLKGLEEMSFEAIQQESRDEIEAMVEFMPKPELARMAEALVNLTSIKRRVSRGFETVGGPIDVAVISKAEGFVWVKRKHYFPAELNSRFFGRIKHD